MNKKQILGLAVILLLIFFSTRLIEVDRFPVFIDETIHIHYGERMLETGSPVYDDIGRLFTIWWLIPFQPVLSSPIWIARTALLLLTLPGFAALLTIGRRYGQLTGIFLVGLFLIFSPYLYFFGRLALADPVAGSFVGLALVPALRLRERKRTLDAVLTGGLLFVAYGFKVASIYYSVLFLAALIALKPNTRPWREHLQWIAISVGTYGLLMLLYNGGLFLAGHSALLTGIRYALTGRATATVSSPSILQQLPARVVINAADTIRLFVHYAGWPLAALIALGLLALIKRREFFWLIVIILPLTAIWAQTAQNSRYFYTAMTLLLTAGALTIAQLLARLPSRWRATAISALSLFLVLHWLPYFETSLMAPHEMPLFERDIAEHIRSDAGGFGLAEVEVFLTQHSAHTVFGLLANCQGLRYMSLGEFEVICPRVNPNGEDIPALKELVDENRLPGAFAVVEDSPFIPERVSGTRLTMIEDPSGRPTLSIYDLAP